MAPALGADRARRLLGRPRTRDANHGVLRRVKDTNTFGASGYFNTVSVTTPDDIPGAPRATYRRPEQTIRKTRADLDRRFQQRDELVTARSTACDFASSLLTVMSVLTPHATVMGL